MNVLKQVRILYKNIYKSGVSANLRKCSTKSLYEPPYLESMKSKVPLYDAINIQLRGYDYPVLENYQKFLHNMLKNMDISVEDSWAIPPQSLQILRYKPKSSVLDSEYKLKMYERNIQIVDIQSIQFPILLRILEASLPEGVTLNVNEHDDWSDEIRYVPDKELIDLKTQLEDMIPASKKK